MTQANPFIIEALALRFRSMAVVGGICASLSLLPHSGCRDARHRDRAESTKGNTLAVLELDSLQFVRLQRADQQKQPTSMDVSIVRFVPDPPHAMLQHVDLVSAVHIADQWYYDELNRRFREYDCVLYELVAEAGTRIRPGQRSQNMVSVIQRQMKQILGLSFQLESVDYLAGNMVHADLSPSEVEKRMRERGESWLSIMLHVMLESTMQSTGKPWKNNDREFFAAILARDRDIRLKRLMAEQLSDVKLMTALFEGTNGSTMITDRNARCLEVLQQQMDRKKRRIAIFYGAGHMPDLARRLARDFNLVPTEETWLTAWDLHADGERKVDQPAQP